MSTYFVCASNISSVYFKDTLFKIKAVFVYFTAKYSIETRMLICFISCIYCLFVCMKSILLYASNLIFRQYLK